MQTVAPWMPPSISRTMLRARAIVDEVVVNPLVAVAREHVWEPVASGIGDWARRWGLREIEGCDAVDGIEPLCGGGLVYPRNVEALPDGRHLLISDVSSYGRAQLGRLLVLDSETDNIWQLLPTAKPKRVG